MLMAPDKNKTLQIIIGAGGEIGEGSDEDALLAGKREAFLDFSHAVKNGDAEKGIEAFKNLYELCQASHEEESLAEVPPGPSPEEDFVSKVRQSKGY